MYWFSLLSGNFTQSLMHTSEITVQAIIDKLLKQVPVKLGRKKALVVLGHANSEQAGMEWGARRIKLQLPDCVPAHYVPTGDPFQFA